MLNTLGWPRVVLLDFGSEVGLRLGVILCVLAFDEFEVQLKLGELGLGLLLLFVLLHLKVITFGKTKAVNSRFNLLFLL